MIKIKEIDSNCLHFQSAQEMEINRFKGSIFLSIKLLVSGKGTPNANHQLAGPVIFLGYQLQGFTAVVIAVVCNTYRFCILVSVACRTVVATFSFLSNDDGLLLRDLQLSMKNNKHVEGATLAAKICSK